MKTARIVPLRTMKQRLKVHQEVTEKVRKPKERFSWWWIAVVAITAFGIFMGFLQRAYPCGPMSEDIKIRTLPIV